MTAEIKTFSPKQRLAMSWWSRRETSRYDAIICDGAVRSGKTLSMSIGFVSWAMTAFQGGTFALCGKTVTSLKRNVMTPLLRLLGSLGFTCMERVSRNFVDIRLAGVCNRFYLFGGRDESSAALIQGMTLCGVFLDEVALMPRSFVEQAMARCSVTGSRIWFNCNPGSPVHWFYREWILKAKQRRALYLHFTMEDNPALTPRIRARYQNSYSGVFFRRFVLGEWTAAQGLVYDFFDRQRDAVPPPAGPFSEWRISADYGTANPASFGLWGRMEEVWYRVAEYYYDSRKTGEQHTDAEYARELQRLAGEREISRVIVDPSAASFIEVLRRAGFAVVRANNDVSDGIRVTADLLKRGRIVLCDTCTDCLREMELYCWDLARGRDAPKKEHDHAMDDMRYFAMDVASEGAGGFAAVAVERRA